MVGIRKKIIGGLMVVGMVLAGGLMVTPVVAKDDATVNDFNKGLCESDISDKLKKQAGCKNAGATSKKIPEVAVAGLNWFLGIIGLVSVVTVVTGGQRMVTSEGEPGRVKQARMMIVFGVVGLFVSMIAFTFVNFILVNALK